MSERKINGKKRIVILCVVVAGAFLASLGQSLLTSSIPVLSRTFRVSETTGEWLTTIYILTLGVVSALTACLINRIPTRKLFLGSIFLLMFGCACSLFATNFTILLASRVVQAFGAGVMLPLAQVLVLHLFPHEQHGRAFSTAGLVVAFAPAIGPVLAGVIVEGLGWRGIFYLMLAIATCIWVAGYYFLEDVGRNFPDKLDVFSALLYGVGFCALMVGITKYSAIKHNPVQFVLPTVAGTVLLVLFTRHSFKVENPLLNLRLFKKRDFTTPFLLVAIAYVASMSGVMLLPLYLQVARGVSETVSGLVMLPGAVAILVSNPISGKVLDAKGPRPPSVGGMMLMVVGTAGFCAFDAHTPLSVVALFYCLRTIGMTFTMMPLTAYCVGGLRGADITHGNAILTSLRQMFGTIGATALVVVTEMASANGSTDVRGVNASFAVQTALFLFGLVLAVKFIKNPT